MRFLSAQMKDQKHPCWGFVYFFTDFFIFSYPIHISFASMLAISRINRLLHDHFDVQIYSKVWLYVRVRCAYRFSVAKLY